MCEKSYPTCEPVLGSRRLCFETLSFRSLFSLPVSLFAPPLTGPTHLSPLSRWRQR